MLTLARDFSCVCVSIKQRRLLSIYYIASTIVRLDCTQQQMAFGRAHNTQQSGEKTFYWITLEHLFTLTSNTNPIRRASARRL